MPAGQDDRLTIAVVEDPRAVDPEAICVTLFQERERLMAWFIGPVEINRTGVFMPYLPKSDRCGVATALLAAMGQAMLGRRNICVLDPDALWATV